MDLAGARDEALATIRAFSGGVALDKKGSIVYIFLVSLGGVSQLPALLIDPVRGSYEKAVFMLRCTADALRNAVAPSSERHRGHETDT